jgi:ADP-ribose pyrophosphatase YjhB (NUDIX family)
MNIKYLLAQAYWKIVKPNTLGARLLLINDGKVLLIKQNNYNRYCLPGGRVEKRETFEGAVLREVKEELDLDIQNLNLFGTYQNNYEGKSDTIVVFISTDKVKIENLKLDPNEVKEANFFDLNNIPDDIFIGTRKRIEEYIMNKYPIATIWCDPL